MRLIKSTSSKKARTGRSPNRIDAEIGTRMRSRREQIGLSMDAVAERLGVTTHQVRKYEMGINRLGASRAVEVARILDMTVTSLLGVQADPGETKQPKTGALALSPDVAESLAELIFHFSKIGDTAGRSAVVEFAKHIALASSPKT